MFTRQHSILQDELGGVKVDPALSRSRISRVLMCIAAAIWVTTLILSFLLHESSPFYPSFLYIFIVTIVIFNIISVTKRVRYQERLEQRRQAAARGDQNLLAPEQPLQDATALPLPITLRRRHSGKMYLRLLTVMLLLVLILFILFYIVLSFLFPLLPGSQLSPQTFVLIILVSFAFVILLVFGLSFGMLYAQEREQLTVTEHGLMKFGLWSKIQSVSWQEARLFAISGTNGLKKTGRLAARIPSQYELSSANDIIRWGPLPDTNIQAFVSGETASPLPAQGNYRQALHSLIAARTGLPLYDLRES